MLISLIGPFLAIILSFINLSAKSYWFDESYSVVISQNFFQNWKILWSQDGNSWFYYLLLHYWLALGSSELLTRYLSAIFGAIAVFVTYKLGKKLFNPQVALLASIIMPINVFYLLHIQETRSYALLLLLSTLSSYFFICRLEKKSPLHTLSFILVGIFGLYTHLYMAFVLASQFLSLIFRKNKLTEWVSHLLTFLTIFLSLALLIFSPGFRSGQLNWISVPKITSLGGTAILLAGDWLPIFLIYLLLMAFLIFHHVKNYRLPGWPLSFLSIWIIFPILSAFVFSIVLFPVYQSVYFIICLVPFLLLVSQSLSLVTNKYLKYFFILAIFGFSAVRLAGWYLGDSRLSLVINNRNEDWRGVADYVFTNRQPGDQIIFDAYHGRLPFTLYWPQAPVTEITVQSYLLGGGGLLPDPDKNILQNLKSPRLWLVLFHAKGVQLDRDRQRVIIENSLSTGYFLSQTKEFDRIEVRLYQRNY